MQRAAECLESIKINLQDLDVQYLKNCTEIFIL
jgi:hypothetical protein